MSGRVFNLLAFGLEAVDDAPEGHRFSAAWPARGLGAKLTGFGMYEVEPGEAVWPYHFELVEEEWLIVVAGELVLRTPDGEQRLRPGDAVCFPPGPAGAHAVRNDGEEIARFVMPSSVSKYGDGVVYPDSGKFRLASKDYSHRGWLGEPVPYWEGET
jgi:uncharacterized cupin superfamily protein